MTLNHLSFILGVQLSIILEVQLSIILEVQLSIILEVQLSIILEVQLSIVLEVQLSIILEVQLSIILEVQLSIILEVQLSIILEVQLSIILGVQLSIIFARPALLSSSRGPSRRLRTICYLCTASRQRGGANLRMWWVLTLISGVLLSLGVKQIRSPRVLRQYSNLEHLTRDGIHLDPHTPSSRDLSRLIQRIQILANTSTIASDHPVVAAVVQRWRAQSLPGERTDPYKIGLAIEGVTHKILQ